MSKLNQEEREILDALDAGKLKKSRSAGRIRKQHQEYAETMLKTARSVLRENQQDLAAFDKRAAEPVISYETLLRNLKADRK